MLSSDALLDTAIFLSIAADCTLAGVVAARACRGTTVAPMLCIAFFALADLIRLCPVVVVRHVQKASTTPGACEPLAFTLWYGIWASTLWMCAYADALHQHFRATHTPGLQRWRWAAYHLGCWLTPIVVFGPATACGLFGSRDHFCTTREYWLGAVFASITFVAAVFSLACLISTQLYLQRQAASVADVLDCASSVRIAQMAREPFCSRFSGPCPRACRIEIHICASINSPSLDAAGVWPTFSLYAIIFLVSQVPESVFDFHRAAGGSVPNRLHTAFLVLYFGHGALNGIVYGRSLIPRGCVAAVAQRLATRRARQALVGSLQDKECQGSVNDLPSLRSEMCSVRAGGVLALHDDAAQLPV